MGAVRLCDDVGHTLLTRALPPCARPIACRPGAVNRSPHRHGQHASRYRVRMLQRGNIWSGAARNKGQPSSATPGFIPDFIPDSPEPRRGKSLPRSSDHKQELRVPGHTNMAVGMSRYEPNPTPRRQGNVLEMDALEQHAVCSSG